MPQLSETMSDVHIPYFDRQLHDNYHSTDYCCQNFRIQPKVANAEFLDFLRVNDWQDFAFITAYNPYSATDVTAEENDKSHKKLLSAISQQLLTFLPAYSKDRNGHWPAEAGFFLFNAGLSRTLSMAADFRQNAILWGTQLTHPEIIWTHGKLA